MPRRVPDRVSLNFQIGIKMKIITKEQFAQNRVNFESGDVAKKLLKSIESKVDIKIYLESKSLEELEQLIDMCLIDNNYIKLKFDEKTQSNFKETFWKIFQPRWEAKIEREKLNPTTPVSQP